MDYYSSYKDSGVEWIQKIPLSWNKSRIRMVGKLYGGLTGKKGNDFNNDDSPFNKPFVPFTNIFNNTYISKNHFQYVKIGEGENQNRVLKYDLFFLMSSESYEDLGKCSILLEDIEELYLNSFCKGYRIKDKRVNPLFLNYQLLGSLHKEMISIEGNGFTRINLRQDRLLDIPVFIPPLNEQTQIVSFLDTKTQKIDELIEKTEQKIKLLKEKRDSLINHCVTKGLNPNVEMKDSGVEWIGEIPRDWNTNKVKFVSTIKRGSSPRPIDEPKYFEDGGEYGWVRISDVTKCGKYLTNTTQQLSELGKSCSLPLENNTLCMSISGSVGKVFITRIKCCIHDGFVSFNNLLINQEFLYLLLTNKELYSEDRKLGTQFNINSQLVGNKKIPIPNITEQTQIVEYLDEQTQKIDSTIEKETQRIELLKEYRQSLISEVVTGKVDVRDYNG
jgi:type I restriction enzyme, S subunit